MSFSDRTKSHNPAPVTEAGKAMNALKHGCCATEVVLLETENPEDYKSLQNTWCKAYNPSTEPERKLVEELVQADWMLQRAKRSYLQVEAKLLTDQPDQTQWTEAQQRLLGRFLRYQTTHNNNFIKTKKSIEDYRKARLAEKANTEKQNIAQERLKIFKDKNRPEPTWKEHIENMRRQAQELGLSPKSSPRDFTKR